MDGCGVPNNVSDRQFFAHVTNSVVVAVVACEVGEVEVERLLAMLTSWNVQALTAHMSVTLLSWGQLSLKDGGVAVHTAAEPSSGRLFLCEELVWAVVDVQRAAGGRGRPLHVYAALNVGREGWCVLTANFHTLVHVLRNHNMNTDDLIRQNKCETSCEHRQDYLVPRARASQRSHPGVTRPFTFRWYMYRVKQARQMAYMMLVDSEEVWRVVGPHVHYYLAQSDPDNGWCLLAGFDVETRKHRAAGRHSLTQPVLEVAREELEAREFLIGVRPLLREREESTVNEFLRNFTRVNTVKWEEAMEMICGELSLREAAFQRVCQLPLPYLQQHAPPHLYTTVSQTHTVSWTPVTHLKTRQDVT